MPLSSRLLPAVLLALGLVGAPGRGSAQGAQIGLIGGATFSNLRGLDDIDDVDLDSRTGLIGGGYLLLPLSGALQLQLEGLLVNKGAEPRTGTDNELKLSYFEVPVLLRLNLGGSSALNPHLYAGPYFGLRINCTIGDDTDCEDASGISTKSVDVGGVAGGGLAIDVGGLVLTGGARYAFGVSTLAELSGDGIQESVKHGGWAIYAGLGVRLGSR
jgi:hypothetical protein